jgi:lysozyme
VIDFPAARRAGKEFCFLRVGRGVPGSGTDTAGLDNRWFSFVRGAESVGLEKGGYWRFFPSVDLDLQISAFCTRLLANQMDLPPLVDIEDAEGLDQATLTNWAVRAMTGVQAKLGVQPILYTNKSFLAVNLDWTKLSRWPLGLARWTTDPAWPDERATYWQYTGNSKVSWAKGPVDFQRTRRP